MAIKNKKELVRQIEAYGLRHKLAELAKREVAKRPFRHLPKQFSKGILIGNIAIVPKKYTGTRYVYVIADMMEAKLLYEDINLKQTAILLIVKCKLFQCAIILEKEMGQRERKR